MIAAGYGAVVFDLDGTLADTAVDIHDALARSLASENLPPVALGAVRLMIGGGPRLLVERALERIGRPAEGPLVERLVDAFRTEYLGAKNRQSRLFPGADSALRNLHASGVCIGLCSNKPDDLCRALLRNLGVDHYFDEILGSSDTIPNKPDPAMLLAVIERLGVTPQDTLYVGDSETDITTARAAGVPVMLVSYGYTLRKASQLGADGVIDSLAELVGSGPYAQSA